MSVRKQSTKNEKAVPYLHFIKLCLDYAEDGMGRGFIRFAPRQARKSNEPATDQSATAGADRVDPVTASHAARRQLEGSTTL
jgi:hypothetical protein